jgi:ribosomal protein S18 acetylase RimI-like enzyme
MWIGMRGDSSKDAGVVIEPSLDQVLAFCAREPIERVFLEDIARRGLGLFVAIAEDGDELTALCHVGANVVPSGVGCASFAASLGRTRSRMVIGEEHAVDELWSAARRVLPTPREDRPGQPVYLITEPPATGETTLRAARPDDLERLVPAAAAAHREELGVDPLAADAQGFRWRTAAQIDEGRSWLWIEDGVILFKAEASAWTSAAVQVQQVWVDPEVRGRGYGQRGMRDLCLLLLEKTPAVTLFVRTDNVVAIRVYERIGMRRVLTYRSILFP